MPLGPSTYYSFRMLQPKYYPEFVTNFGATLVANQSIAAGTIMGQTTSASVNDVWTIGSTGTVTSGNVVFTYGGVIHTVPVASTASQTAAIINANLNATYGSSGTAYVTVTGGPLTTNTSLVVTAVAGGLQGQPQTITNQSSSIVGGGSASYTHTTTGIAFNSWAPYNSGNSDGTQVAKGILRYAVTVDSIGGIVLGSTASVTTQVKDPTTPIAVEGGQWDLADLTGYDAAAIASLGVLVSGSVASGVGVLALNG